VPITVVMMKAACASGLSAVCAACERYWEAREKGIPGDRCLARGPCGSPLSGDYFRYYRGILTAEAFQRFCFVCAEAATHRLSNPGWPRCIGACDEHVRWLQDPRMRQRLRERPKRNGFVLPPAGTLAGEILRTEKEWADRGGYEFRPEEIMGAAREGEDDTG